MFLPVTTEPNPILHQVGRDIDPEELKTRAMKKLMKDMIETMYIKDGVGIAAHQVGQPIRMCVIAKEFSPIKDQLYEDLILVNPVWEKLSAKQIWDHEGCLSVPGKIYGKIKRYTHVRVKALDKNGNKLEFEAKDFPACIVQHEVDHLGGHLFIEKAKDLRPLTEND